MKNVLGKDISIKVISILLAILFWLFVINVDNPYQPKQIPVPVKIINRDTLVEKGLYLKNERDLPVVIQVSVSGRKDVTDSLSPADFIAELDFSRISSVKDKSIRIDQPYLLSVKSGVAITSYSPHGVKIELENILNGSFPVEVSTTGTPRQGYKVLKATVSSDSISLEGLESVVNTIGSIKAVVDVSNAIGNIEKKVLCKVYNKDGKEITAFKNYVDARVEIGKTVPVTAVVKGKPAEDYVEVQRTVSPQTVVITGDTQLLGTIADIRTEQLDITNTMTSINTSIPLKLPVGIKLAEGAADASVNITIDKLEQKNFQINKNDINVVPPPDSNLKYEVKVENVNISLKGRQTDIADISVDKLKPVLDLSGLDAGTHKVRLNITLPLQVKLVQEIEIEVKLTRESAAVKS